MIDVVVCQSVQEFGQQIGTCILVSAAARRLCQDMDASGVLPDELQ